METILGSSFVSWYIDIIESRCHSESTERYLEVDVLTLI